MIWCLCGPRLQNDGPCALFYTIHTDTLTYTHTLTLKYINAFKFYPIFIRMACVPFLPCRHVFGNCIKLVGVNLFYFTMHTVIQIQVWLVDVRHIHVRYSVCFLSPWCWCCSIPLYYSFTIEFISLLFFLHFALTALVSFLDRLCWAISLSLSLFFNTYIFLTHICDQMHGWLCICKLNAIAFSISLTFYTIGK